jgi:hypothetical protein
VTTLLTLGGSPPEHIDRWRRDAYGEKATAKRVRGLVRRGWVLVNDIDIGLGNIDHVLIGPPGVFLLESKWLAGLVSVSRGVLTVTPREDPDDGYENHTFAACPHRCRPGRLPPARLGHAGDVGATRDRAVGEVRPAAGPQRSRRLDPGQAVGRCLDAPADQDASGGD